MPMPNAPMPTVWTATNRFALRFALGLPLIMGAAVVLMLLVSLGGQPEMTAVFLGVGGLALIFACVALLVIAILLVQGFFEARRVGVPARSRWCCVALLALVAPASVASCAGLLGASASIVAPLDFELLPDGPGGPR